MYLQYKKIIRNAINTIPNRLFSKIPTIKHLIINTAMVKNDLLPSIRTRDHKFERIGRSRSTRFH